MAFMVPPRIVGGYSSSYWDDRRREYADSSKPKEKKEEEPKKKEEEEDDSKLKDYLFSLIKSAREAARKKYHSQVLASDYKVVDISDTKMCDAFFEGMLWLLDKAVQGDGEFEALVEAMKEKEKVNGKENADSEIE